MHYKNYKTIIFPAPKITLSTTEKNIKLIDII